MDLGSIIIRNEQNLLEARNKIYEICYDFNLSSFNIIKIATLTSDILRTVLTAGSQCTLNISYDKIDNKYGLRFHFISEAIDFFLSDVMNSFSSVKKNINKEEQDFEFFIFLTNNFDEKFVEKEKDKFIKKSQDELLGDLTISYDKIKKQNAFLGMAVHDLRNPLNVIMQIIPFFHENEITKLQKKELNEMIDILNANTATMKSLIDNLLEISIFDSTPLKLELIDVDMLDLIEKIVASNKFISNKKQIGLSFIKPDFVLPFLKIDKEKFNEVLNNLINNAIKYSHPNTAITISLIKKEGFIILKIQDQGKGISKDKAEKIFIPFGVRGEKGTQGEKSTGLGLFITKKIIESHGGELWFESEEEKGTAFFIKLYL